MRVPSLVMTMTATHIQYTYSYNRQQVYQTIPLSARTQDRQRCVSRATGGGDGRQMADGCDDGGGDGGGDGGDKGLQ